MIVQCAECKTSYRLQAELVPPRRIKTRCNRCGHVFAIVGPEADSQGSSSLGRPSDGSARQAPYEPSRYGEVDLGAGPQPSPTGPSSKPFVPPIAPAMPSQAPAAQAPARAAAPAPAAPSEAAPPSGGRDTEFKIERSEGFPGSAPMTHASAGLHAPAAGSLDQAKASSVALETPPASSSSSFRELDLDESALASSPEPEAATVSPEEQRKQDKSRRLARALVSDILVYNRAKRDAALVSGKLVQELGPEIKKSWEVYKERVTPEVANSTNHFREALNDILADGQPIF